MLLQLLPKAERLNPYHAVQSTTPDMTTFLRCVCAMRAEYVCRLVFPGVRTCSHFEGGMLHLWIGGLVVHPLLG